MFIAQQEERLSAFSEVTQGMSARAKAMMEEDIERPFDSKSCVSDVLELLRLMCEGHNVEMQDYLRHQHNQLTTYDLVSEIYLMFEALEPELDTNNVEQAVLVTKTLTELVQGNTSHGNSALLLQTKLVSILERLLQKRSIDGDGNAGLSELRVAALQLLVSLFEDCAEEGRARIFKLLDIKGLTSALTMSYAAANQMDTHVKIAPPATLKLEEDAAYLNYMLLTNLRDWRDRRDGVLPGQVQHVDGLDKDTKVALDETVGAVEIVNALGELERVTFRYPPSCKLLSRAARDRILWGVDRETPGRQLVDFVYTFAPDVYREMGHLAKLEKWETWQTLTWTHTDLYVVDVMFGLAVVQNLCLLARFSAWEMDLVQTEGLFGTAQLVCSGAVFVRHYIHNLYRGWYELLFDKQLLFLTAAAFFAILGLFWSPFFFCFHLLDVVNKSAILQNVFRAVTQNGISLLLTALFGFIVIWIYAVVGYASFPELFIAFDDPTDAAGGDATIDMCPDLFVCWLSAAFSGLRGGDIGSFMVNVQSTDEHYAGLAAFTFVRLAVRNHTLLTRNASR